MNKLLLLLNATLITLSSTMTQAAYQRLKLEEQVFAHKTLKKLVEPIHHDMYIALRKNETILNLLAENILNGKAGLPQKRLEVLADKIAPIVMAELDKQFVKPARK